MPDGPAEANWQWLSDTDRIFSARPNVRLFGTYSGRLWDTRDTQRIWCATAIRQPAFLPQWELPQDRQIIVFHLAICRNKRQAFDLSLSYQQAIERV